MSDLSGTLGLTAAQPAGCGRGLTEEQDCVEVSGGLEGPELWARDLGVPERSLEPHSDGAVPVTCAPPSLPPSGPVPLPPTLANGVRMSRRPLTGARRRSQLLEAAVLREARETPAETSAETPAETARGMQAPSEPGVDAHAVSQPPQNNSGFCTNALAEESHAGSGGPGQVRTSPAAETPRTASPPPPPPPPLSLINHPVAVADQPAPFDLTAARELPSTLIPAPLGPGPPPDPASSALPVEAERKYALRSSGRPRFPCHLRKSSRIRRSAEDGDRKGRKEEEKEGGTEGAQDDQLLRVREEAGAAGQGKEPPSGDGKVPAVPCPAQLPVALTVPSKPVPKATPKSGPKPGPKLGPKPGPRPSPKSARRPGPKSVQRTSQTSAPSSRPGPHPAFPRTAGLPGPPPAAVKKEPTELEVTPATKRRRGRFVGVRRIVVKVARIPVNLSRRQKSYKISNLETLSGPEKGSEGLPEGPDPVREPTALLRMKNNGKSVMVMFPPGELPVILKRRRGRPPKQAPPPGIPGEALGTAGGGGDPDQPKKPRRRRRTKLPCPYPSYVNDTNDVKSEYGDVLSKLAFLNRQPPATARCSPPRCWTPSEPESFHVPSENPGISTLLHRLTGFRRRGGRGGGVGRGGGAAGGAAGGDFNKNTFSDFFESIGKKRKLSPLSETGLPRKRGKGANAGGTGRGGGVVGSELGGDKPVRKRRSRKNGALKGEAGALGPDWGNGAGPWGEEGGMEKGGPYQACGSPRGGFSSCEAGRGGPFGGAGGGRGAGPGAEGPQGLFAGYFRSLLDSDDSSDLLDGSSQRESRKAASTPGYEPSSPLPGPSWSPAFPKRSPKAMGAAGEGPAQTQPSSARTPYSYNSLAQTSPTPPGYPKPAAPSLSLSHSPSSPHPSSYGSYSSGFSAASPPGGGGAPQRPLDCSFSLGPGQSKGPALSAAQMGYSGYQLAAKRGFGGYPGAGQCPAGRGELGGPTSPGGGYMSVAKCSPFSSSVSPEGYRQYSSSQWSYRQGYGGWAADSFGSQYHNYSEYGSNESKDILDISNYTPQKAKRQPFPESLSESSSDSSHLSSAATGSGPSSGGGSFRQKDSAAPLCADSGQSSLSSLEKLMMDWHESAAGPSYNWSQNVLFQSAGSSKQGRGRRKRAEPPAAEKERAAALPPDSPSIPSPAPAPKRGGAGGRPRGSRGGRGGLSPCQRERPSGAKGRARSASALSVGGAAGGPECSELFQEGPDYYSGDSCSLSPLATPNPAAPGPYLQDPSEYPSPYSAHPSTPSSEERYPAVYPGESSASLSPSVSSPPYPPKPTPPPAQQAFHPGPSRTFSPSCSPAPRAAPHGSTALSPPHRAPPKDPQYSQYDSPSYCSSPFWYGPSSHSGSLSPQTHPGGHSGPAPHAHPANTHPNNPHNLHNPHNPHNPQNPHPNSHMSPHGHAQVNPLASTHANAHHHNAHPNTHPATHPATHPNTHPNTHPSATLSPHASTQQQLHAGPHLHPNPHAHPAPHGGGGGNSSQPHPHHSNPHLHPHHTPHSSPGLHPHPAAMGFEDRHPPSPMAHKQQMGPGHHQGPLPHSPYHKPPLDSSPHQEDMGGYALPHHPYQGGGQRYAAQAGRGGGVLCQLLEPASEDGFSVTSL